MKLKIFTKCYEVCSLLLPLTGTISLTTGRHVRISEYRTKKMEMQGGQEGLPEYRPGSVSPQGNVFFRQSSVSEAA